MATNCYEQALMKLKTRGIELRHDLKAATQLVGLHHINDVKWSQHIDAWDSAYEESRRHTTCVGNDCRAKAVNSNG